MANVEICRVRDCNRRITDPADTYVFCGQCWWQVLTPKWRQRIKYAYEDWVDGNITMEERRSWERDALAFAERNRKGG